MTPEELLIDEVKKAIPDYEYCFSGDSGLCFYFYDVSDEATYCYLFPFPCAERIKTDDEHVPLRTRRCLELKPPKENA